MRFALKPTCQIPYGGSFVVTDPMTGLEISGTNFKMVLKRLRESRRANGVPVGLGVEEELESWICAKYPDECEAIDARLPKTRRLGLSDVLRGTIAMAAHRLAGSPHVSQEEANRRADICSRCPLNVNVQTNCGGGCPELHSLVNSIVGAKATPSENALKGCQICGCWNSAQIWMPYDILNMAMNDEMRDQFKAANEAYGCWKVPTT